MSLPQSPFPGPASLSCRSGAVPRAALFPVLSPQMDQLRWNHLQVSLDAEPSPGLRQATPRGSQGPPIPAFVPAGSLASWPRSQEVPGKMCVTSLRNLTRTNRQVPSSPSSPKFCWATENEVKPQAPSPRQHCPSQHPQRSLPWPGPYERGSGSSSLGHCSSLPLPAKLNEWALGMTWHVSRWQRQV